VGSWSQLTDWRRVSQGQGKQLRNSLLELCKSDSIAVRRPDQMMTSCAAEQFRLGMAEQRHASPKHVAQFERSAELLGDSIHKSFDVALLLWRQ
jgi:hypothetical protein